MRVVNLIENTPGAEGCVPAHGLAFYVETVAYKILVDAGPSDETLRNAERLGVDLRTVDVAILSHGHYDHSGGLLAFAELNPTAAIYMQRSAGGDYYAFDGPEKGYRYIGIDKSILSLPQVRLLDGDTRIDDIGIDKSILSLPQVRLLDGDTRIDDEIAVFTVERRNHPLPSTNKRIMKKEGEGYVQDDFVHEQSLYVRSAGARAVISGCAHSGVLNILDEFVRKFGRENLPQVVVSGFHLMRSTGYDGTDIREQEEIARRLMDYPCRFYTCHCTGVEPFARMKDIMGDRLEYIHTGGKIDVR